MPAAPLGAGLPVRPATPPRRPLGELAAAVPGLRVPARADTVVTGCTLDSRAVQPGRPVRRAAGARAHGADFAASAAAAGAAAVLTDPAGADRARATGLPVVLADDPRVAARGHRGGPARPPRRRA